MELRTLLPAALAAALVLGPVLATAADVEVTCEKRAHRSRASVDGSNLERGSYRAVLKSGDKVARSAFASTVGDEVEFDFDSNPNEIADGATAIPAGFILDGRVRAYLVNDNNQRVTPVVRAICRVRR